jgi:hypothetical protein
MKITIESTTKIVELETGRAGISVSARVWEGQTDQGTPVFCFIPRIAPSIPEHELTPAVLEEFAKSLRECKAPTPAVQAIDMRLIL